jgi:hypothetical protein
MDFLGPKKPSSASRTPSSKEKILKQLSKPKENLYPSCLESLVQQSKSAAPSAEFGSLYSVSYQAVTD